jgi:hypothetical protein
MEEKIRFSIRGPEGVYRGEAKGKELRENAVFEVELSTGEQFVVKALPDKKNGFSWIPAKERFSNIAQVVGNVIERYYRRKQKAA